MPAELHQTPVAAQPSTAQVRRAVERLSRVVLRDLHDSKNAASKRRKDAGYVQSTPRCGNCVNLQFPMRDKRGISTGHVCRLLVCRVETVGLCDRWAGVDGSSLET